MSALPILYGKHIIRGSFFRNAYHGCLLPHPGQTFRNHGTAFIKHQVRSHSSVFQKLNDHGAAVSGYFLLRTE